MWGYAGPVIVIALVSAALYIVISGYISTEMVQQSCSQLNTLPSKIKRKDNSKLLYCIEAIRKNNANYPLLRRKC